MSAIATSLVPSLWDAEHAKTLGPVEQLVYGSNLLGSDLRVTNFGGGNTSTKVEMADPITGEPVQVMWVKASGGDLGSSKLSNFASLYLDKLHAIKQRFDAGLHEDDIVALYMHCVYNQNPAVPSIDTPIHFMVPQPCVSHVHADSVIAIAASDRAEALAQQIWKGKLGFLPWKRPGYELAIMLKALIDSNPSLKGALLQSHGFVCWADTWEEAYHLTLEIINDAQGYLDERVKEPFGPIVGKVREPDANAMWEKLLPTLRGKVAYQGQRLIAQLDTDDVTLDFLAREKRDKLVAMGTSCPDHFLRTKICPLVLDGIPWNGDLGSYLDQKLDGFRANYAGYYERCKHPDSPALRNPNPSVVLVPGLGMASFGKTVNESKITGQFYRNAIEVMRGAESVGNYVALPEQEAFDIEYWLLEEAKLMRLPPEKELSRQIAIISGGAQGIGLATAKKMASLGACVAILDIDESRLAEAESAIATDSGVKGAVLPILCDVTDSLAVELAVGKTIRTYGGLDIAVIAAGNARRGSIGETSDADFDYMSQLLMRGYFNVMREAVRTMERQGTGGSIVVVASKNGTATGSKAAVYSAAKAFELHLMRSVAVDSSKSGIRCNAINPDAVLSGSGIWSDQWRNETASLLGIAPDQLEEHYRKRSLLGVQVTPEDCAEAICWLASEKRSSRTTGCVIPVDGGNREGFLR